VVVAHDLEDAHASLDQDFYDIVIADTSLKGLGAKDAAPKLRSHITRDAESVLIVAASLEHSPRFREEKLAAGFDATIAKPFRKDDLLALLAVRSREPEQAD